jgi:hypothetical protein
MLELPDVPVLILRHDYRDYPWHVLDEAGTLLAVGRYPPRVGKRPRVTSPMNLRVLEFSSPAGVAWLTTELTGPWMRTVTNADGSAYGVVRYGHRRARRLEGVQYSLLDGHGDLVGRAVYRPVQEVDHRLPSWRYFVSDRNDLDVGHVIRHTNYDAARVELRFIAPVSPRLAVLCLAAEASQRTVR